MANTLDIGFGANVTDVATANGGTIEARTRIIQSPGGNSNSAIRKICVSATKSADGTIPVGAYIPLAVVLMPLDRSPDAGRYALITGFPTSAGVQGGITVMFLVRAIPGKDYCFSERELIAGMGQQLAVIANPMVDPSSGVGVTSLLELSVLGDTNNNTQNVKLR